MKMKYAHGLSDYEFGKAVQRKRTARMNSVDQMPRAMRDLVNEYGLSIVNQFHNCGVVDPKRIKHLIESTLDELSPGRATKSAQGPQSHVARKMTEAHINREDTANDARRNRRDGL